MPPFGQDATQLRAPRIPAKPSDDSSISESSSMTSPQHTALAFGPAHGGDDDEEDEETNVRSEGRRATSGGEPNVLNARAQRGLVLQPGGDRSEEFSESDDLAEITEEPASQQPSSQQRQEQRRAGNFRSMASSIGAEVIGGVIRNSSRKKAGPRKGVFGSLVSRTRRRMSQAVDPEDDTFDGHVRFVEGFAANEAWRTTRVQRMKLRWKRLQEQAFNWLLTLEAVWSQYFRPLVIVTSLFELWSMGIWIGYLTEPTMADTLKKIVFVDIGCNGLYIFDTAFILVKFRVDQLLIKQALAKAREKRAHKHGSHPPSEVPEPSVVHTTEVQQLRQQMDAAEGRTAYYVARARVWIAEMREFLSTERGKHEAKVQCGLVLALVMVPVQLMLYNLLQSGNFDGIEVLCVLVFRCGRVIWAFRDCAKMINQQELEVYVDIRMHGTSGSSWNKVRILSKQFFIVLFVGHWLGCLAYAVRQWAPYIQDAVRFDPDTTRDYFEKFQDEGQINFEVGDTFWENYLLSLYKGLNLNYEDLLPERPLDLLLEVMGSVVILLMKSYCIGSVFKYHQKREFEVQRFTGMMHSVNQYLDLYEVPPSLRKAVVSYFRFQQANHRKIKTLEVIGELPVEVQKKLKEIEVLPIIVERNMNIFGMGISTEYCMQLAILLVPTFLQPGEVIFLEGDVPRELIFLDSGAVSFSRSLVQDGRKVEALLKYVRADRKDDNTMIGGVPLILGCAHFYSARVRAGTEAVILVATRSAFEQLNKIYNDQHDILVRNVAEAHFLDVKGRDLPVGDKTIDYETETFAAMQGDVRKTLLMRQDSMNTLFTYAASSGNVKVVKELLQKRIEANVADYDLRSALHVAASEGMSEVLEALLAANGDANFKDRWGSTPMQDALKNGFVGAAKLLQAHHGVLDLADPAGELCTFASKGDTIQMQQLLDFGVDPNCGDYDARTALHLSSSEGHLPVVTFLTSRKADVNVKDRWGSTPLEDAIRNEFTIVARHLHSCGGYVRASFAEDLLRDAASTGDLKVLQILVETSVDVNKGDYDARTAVHLAAAEGQLMALNYLVNTARAEHSPLDRWNSMPLQDALSANHTLCVQVLLAAGAQLSPTATAEEWAQVEAVACELGFTPGLGRKQFCDMSGALRSRLSSHAKLVEIGRARSDIFDKEQAAKFTHLLITKQVAKMGELCELCAWINHSLSMLETSTRPIGQLYALVKDGSAVASESRFWAEMESAAVQSGSKRKKDGSELVFQKAYIKGLRYTSKLAEVMEYATASIIARVTLSQLRPGSDPTTSVSVLVVQEVLKALRWIDIEENHNRDRLRVAMEGDPNVSAAEMALQVEELARTLLPGEFLILDIYQSTLQIPHNHVMMRPESSSVGQNPALTELLSWLRCACGPVMDRMHAAATEPPTMSPNTGLSMLFGSLGRQSLDSDDGTQSNTSVSTTATQCEPLVATSHLVASELVLIVLTCLVLQGWDRDLTLSDHKRKQIERERKRISEGGKSGNLKGSVKELLTKDDFLDLGSICRSTAKALRGLPSDNLTERKAMVEAAKKEREMQGHDHNDGKTTTTGAATATTDATRGTEEKTADEKAAEEEEEEEDDDEAPKADPDEQLPIRAAKILSMQEKMSLDELVQLIDIDDTFLYSESPDPPIFGDISRERFCLNLLRSMLSHDDSQKEVLNSVVEEAEYLSCTVAGMEDLAAGDLVVAKNLRGKVDGLSDEIAEALQSLYVDTQELQENISLGPGKGGEGSLAESSRKSLLKKPTKSFSGFLRRGNSGGTALSLLVGQQPSRAVEIGMKILQTFRAIGSWVGQDGRSRRRMRRIAKRFRELDDDGEGIGTAEMAQLMAVSYHHSLGQEAELRAAYRVFELLNKADVGDLVTLPELLEVIPKLDEEIKEQQRKNKRSAAVDENSGGTWAITIMLSRMVLPPESTIWKYWDRIRLAICLYYMVEVPIRFCFLSREHLSEVARHLNNMMNAGADIFMFFNIILTFFRGFVHPTRGIVTGFQEIRMNYVFGLFAVDCIACSPLDWFAPDKAPDAGLFSRPRAALRLLRLIHVHHLFNDDQGLEASDGFFRAAFAMIIIILTMVHFLACCWWMLGTRFSGFRDDMRFDDEDHVFEKADLGTTRGSWTYTYVHRPNEPAFASEDGETPFWWQYLISFYWSSGRITGQSSPGNLFAASWFELSWICAMFLLNVAVNGYCDGILVDKVIAGDEGAIEAKAMRRIVDEYLQNTDLPPQLVTEVKASAEESGKLVERQKMEATMITLPHSLKQRIARRLFLQHFAVCEIFQGCSESFLLELGIGCHILSVAKDAQLAHVGESAKHLMILNTGRLAIVNTNGNRLAETTTPGEMVGEMPFIFDLKYVVYITAVEDSRLTVLGRDEFEAACQLYPDDAMALRRGAMKAIEALNIENEDEDKGGKKGKAKSTMSFGTAASSGSAGSSASATVSQAIRRLYAHDLRLVIQKMREEQAAARQDLIGKFIQAAADGEEAAVESILMKSEVGVDEADYDQRTALHLAVCNGHINVVKLLVEVHGASLHSKDRFGHTSMDDAVREKHPEIVLYLRQHGAHYQVDVDVAAQMCQAAYDNDIASLNLSLQEVGVNPNCSDYDKRTPLHLAASEGNVEAVTLLVNLPSINLSPRDRLGNTPLDDAMRHKHLETRRILLSKGAKLGDANLGVVLCELGSQGSLEGLREFQDSEIDLAVSDYDRRSCLHLAASEGRLSVVTFLLVEAKVDPNPLDRFLHTPLDDAIRHDRTAVVALLKDYGGLEGGDPGLKNQVAAFKQKRVQDEENMMHERMEKELKNSEVWEIIDTLQRWREHPTMEEDIHTFATHASNFRSILLKLFHRAVMPSESAHIKREELQMMTPEDAEKMFMTKGYYERLLEQAASGLDTSASRIIATIEAEVVPWINGLSKGEGQVLGLFVPSLQEMVNQILTNLRSRAKMTRLVRKLWFDHQNAGGYQCAPVGLLVHTVAEAPMHLINRARLEALALLWAANPVHTAVKEMEPSEAAGSAAGSPKGSPRNSPRGSADKDAEKKDAAKEALKKKEEMRRKLSMSSSLAISAFSNVRKSTKVIKDVPKRDRMAVSRAEDKFFSNPVRAMLEGTDVLQAYRSTMPRKPWAL